jgi:hypothetical protein
MRVLAYSFHETRAADQARDMLVREFQMKPSDADVAEMADNGMVLAVRAQEDNLPAVKTILERYGGQPASEVPEGWTIR